MGSLSTFFADKPSGWAYGFAAILILLGVALVVVIYRALRGNRIRASSGRGRQQRLGVVDTHDIGGERQLIIVRRDNVEHLIMIGGPNDVVIEPAIVRGEARAMRDREPGAPAWASGETPPSMETGRPLAPEPVAPPEPPQPEPVHREPVLREPSPPEPAPPVEPARPSRLPDLFSRNRRPEAGAEPPKPVENKPTDLSAEDRKLAQAVSSALATEPKSAPIAPPPARPELKSAEAKPPAPPAPQHPAPPRPGDSRPVEAKPVEAKPVEAKSVDAKSVETKPVETKMVEPAPPEPKPVAPKPPLKPSLPLELDLDKLAAALAAPEPPAKAPDLPPPDAARPDFPKPDLTKPELPKVEAPPPASPGLRPPPPFFRPQPPQPAKGPSEPPAPQPPRPAPPPGFSRPASLSPAAPVQPAAAPPVPPAPPAPEPPKPAAPPPPAGVFMQKPSPRPAPAAPAPQPAPPAKPTDELDALASLEEEMAKLLGRPTPEK